MKKNFVLGVAALAAVGFAPVVADAGDVKLGGYYQFRVFNADANTVDEASGVDETEYWTHRLQINMDMNASEKSHAHLRFRPMDGVAIEGANVDADDVSGIATDSDGNGWEIKQLWLETEAWGVGVKVGQMPIELNDKILVNNDTTSYGTIMLSKSFGDMTLVGADVRIDEDNGAGDLNDDEDDLDLYVLSLLGKAGSFDYQGTIAHANGGDNSAVAGVNGGDDDNNTWVALTGHTNMYSIDWTGTLVYENGWDDNSGLERFGDDTGWLAALRVKGEAGFGGWKGYMFYGSEDYNAIIDQPMWSNTWDMSGVGPVDLMKTAAHSNTSATEPGWGATSSETENMFGIGAGLMVKASGWSIDPHIDYMNVVEDDENGVITPIDDAWGGSLLLSTQIQDGTTFSIFGAVVDPDDNENDAVDNGDTMHTVFAEVKMVF